MSPCRAHIAHSLTDNYYLCTVIWIVYITPYLGIGGDVRVSKVNVGVDMMTIGVL